VIRTVLANIRKNYAIYTEDGTEFEISPEFFGNFPCVPGNMLVGTPDGAFFVITKEAFDADWTPVVAEPSPQIDLLAPHDGTGATDEPAPPRTRKSKATPAAD
jgi:hypothetical protein